MIRGTVVIQGGPRGMTKQFRGLVKQGLQDLVRMWHQQIFPGHFEPGAERKYHYDARSPKYTRYKQKARPTAGPLMWSGYSKKMMTRSIRVSGTARSAKGVMSAPRYFWMVPKNQPDKAAEATKVLKSEALQMARMLNDRITKRLSTLRNIEVRRYG